MALKNQNFEMYQGEDKKINFHIVDEDGIDKSLVGATIEWVMNVSNITQIQKSTTNGKILISGNIVQVIIVPSDTLQLLGNYVHEMRFTDINNKSEIVSVGKVTILNSITR